MPSEQQTPHRTIEAAFIEKPVTDGRREFVQVLTSTSLLAMKNDQWGYLRDQASDYRTNPGKGLRISCLECGEPLFVRSKKTGFGHLPELSHYSNSSVPCRWNRGQNLTPDQARAAQYQGRQESELHKRLCNLVFEAAKSDPRFLNGTIDQYRRAETQEHGRYPDVFIEWQDFGSFVCEVQLSRSLQTEISGRENHYAGENVRLLWLFYGAGFAEMELSQSAVDIIRRHRGNAFVIDAASIQASQERGTLILSCYQRRSETQFLAPVLVSLDDLTFPAKGLPYFSDCISHRLLDPPRQARRAWMKVLADLGPRWRNELELPDALRPLVEGLQRTHGELSFFSDEREDGFTVAVLLAFCFTIAAHANGKTNISYVMKPAGTAAIINTMMMHESIGMQRYAPIVDYLIKRTSLSAALPASVQEHLSRAYENMDGNLCLEHEPEWALLTSLIPEVFNEAVREQLAYLEALPPWVTKP